MEISSVGGDRRYDVAEPGGRQEEDLGAGPERSGIRRAAHSSSSAGDASFRGRQLANGLETLRGRPGPSLV